MANFLVTAIHLTIFNVSLQNLYYRVHTLSISPIARMSSKMAAYQLCIDLGPSMH